MRFCTIEEYEEASKKTQYHVINRLNLCLTSPKEALNMSMFSYVVILINCQASPQITGQSRLLQIKINQECPTFTHRLTTTL